MDFATLDTIVRQKRLSARDIIAVCIATTGRASNPMKEALYQLSLDQDTPTATHALHIFTHFDSYDLQWLYDRHDELISRAMAETNPGKLRMLLTLLLRQPFYAEQLRTDFIDFCTTLVTSTALPYALRALGMKLACKQMTLFPELTGELDSIMQLLEQEPLSPGLLSAKRQVQAKIKSARKKHESRARKSHIGQQDKADMGCGPYPLGDKGQDDTTKTQAHR